ncbi:MAG TPA: thermonuclease family protein [Candidatus Eisenbacteria bacterium]|jgi:micrococcal nuclease|nr:thermonuclease family protein [Candidatus Eisenbacteria bacterium]
MRTTAKKIALSLFIFLVAGAAFWAGRSSTGPWPRSNAAHRPLESRIEGTYAVGRTVDGDTFVLDDGSRTRVRVLGINTPETKDPRKPVECFGREAAARLHQLIDGKDVRLVADAGQEDRDRYGRLVRYVMLPDGTDVGLLMIRDGYAYEYTYRSHYERQASYRAAQEEARNAKRGLWADGACTPPPPRRH